MLSQIHVDINNKSKMNQNPNDQNNQNNNYQNNMNGQQQQPFLAYQNNQINQNAGQQPPRRSTMNMQQYQTQEQQIREQNYLRLKAEMQSNNCCYMVIVCIVIGFIFGYRNQTCDAPLRQWLLVALGFYFLFFISTLIELNKMERVRAQSLSYLAFDLIISAGYVGWLIYGNTFIYKDWDDCKVNAPQLLYLMDFLIIVGYFSMLKCGLYCLVGICLIPFLFFAARQAQRPSWLPTPPNVVQNLARNRYAQAPGAQEVTSCCICMSDFGSDDQIIQLPCDRRHIFHDECINDWLNRNNACPLCKAPITQDALNRQRNA